MKDTNWVRGGNKIKERVPANQAGLQHTKNESECGSAEWEWRQRLQASRELKEAWIYTAIDAKDGSRGLMLKRGTEIEIKDEGWNQISGSYNEEENRKESVTAWVMTRGRQEWGGGREKPKLQGHERFNAVADSANRKKNKKKQALFFHSQDDIPGYPGNIVRNTCYLITPTVAVNKDHQNQWVSEGRYLSFWKEKGFAIFCRILLGFCHLAENGEGQTASVRSWHQTVRCWRMREPMGGGGGSHRDAHSHTPCVCRWKGALSSLTHTFKYTVHAHTLHKAATQAKSKNHLNCGASENLKIMLSYIQFLCNIETSWHVSALSANRYTTWQCKKIWNENAGSNYCITKLVVKWLKVCIRDKYTRNQRVFIPVSSFKVEFVCCWSTWVSSLIKPSANRKYSFVSTLVCLTQMKGVREIWCFKCESIYTTVQSASICFILYSAQIAADVYQSCLFWLELL